MTTPSPVKVAAVQAAPIYFDLDACLKKAAKITAKAAKQNCGMIVFGIGI